jgi:hypothetical protein
MLISVAALLCACNGPEPDNGPKVFLMVMENANWSEIKGSPRAPYINHLLTVGAHAEQYYNPPAIHPSEPNYLWLEAGSNFGVDNDDDPSENSQSTTRHLVTQIEAAGLSWKSYQEDISGTNCPLGETKDYVPRHNPMVFFHDVTDDGDRHSQHCIDHVRPYTELAGDLASGAMADYNYLTPDLCHDMHDDCPPTNDGTAQGDAWLSREVPKLMASKAYQDGAVIMITWDEGEDSMQDGPIGFIALGKDVKAGYSNTTYYTHSSTLRTMQEIFGLSPFLRAAAKATDLADLFTAMPSPRGHASAP